MKNKNIIVRGAKMHNLKNINVQIPRDKLTVITGVSGSGKSTLAFDTIYAEGQRRYVESLSTYARQFLKMTEKPEVESIEGLSPAISIDQKTASRNPRSTVGTVTEVYDYLRLLYAKVGTPTCYLCGTKIKKQTSSEIIDFITNLEQKKRIMLLAPVCKNKTGEHLKIIDNIKKDGFIRFRANKELFTINDKEKLDLDTEYSIEIVVDRLVIKDYSPKITTLSDGTKIEEANPERTRMADSVELALKHGHGNIIIVDYDTQEEFLFSETYSCVNHPEISIPEIEPRSFSFNSPHGACSKCHGLGSMLVVQEDRIIPNKNLTIAEGAIHPWASHKWNMNLLEAVAEKYKIDLNKKYQDLTEKEKKIILEGTGDEVFETTFTSKKIQGEFKTKYEGVIKNIERRFLETDSEPAKKQLEKYMKTQICPACNGEKLKKEILGVKILEKNIVEITKFSVSDFLEFFKNIEKDFSEVQQKIAKPILEEIRNRLKFLINVGLPYLTLNRAANTLSGGEAQRIRLATQIGSALLGVLYVLDEPSIGLHQKDNDRLITTMKHLKERYFFIPMIIGLQRTRVNIPFIEIYLQDLFE